MTHACRLPLWSEGVKLQVIPETYFATFTQTFSSFKFQVHLSFCLKEESKYSRIDTFIRAFVTNNREVHSASIKLELTGQSGQGWQQGAESSRPLLVYRARYVLILVRFHIYSRITAFGKATSPQSPIFQTTRKMSAEPFSPSTRLCSFPTIFLLTHKFPMEDNRNPL